MWLLEVPAVYWVNTESAIKYRRRCLRCNKHREYALTETRFRRGQHTSAWSTDRSHTLECQQLWIDLLLCFLQDCDQITSLVAVAVGVERVCSPSVWRTPRTTNTMDVVLRTVRKVVVDYKFHVLHVWTEQASTPINAVTIVNTQLILFDILKENYSL